MITIPCPSCGKAFDTEDSPAGRSAVCPSCAARSSAAPPPSTAGELPAEEQLCPYCAERIKKGARICRFCKTDLERPPEPVLPRIAPQAAGKKSSSAPVWILLGLFAFVGLICVGGGVFLVVGQRGFVGQAMEQQCRMNLNGLYAALRSYEKEEGELPAETGSAFWKKIADGSDTDELLDCPAAVLADTTREAWPYRGPSVAWDRVPEDGIIACDRVRSHRTGLTVLFKNGRVEFAKKDTELYQRALRETSD